MTRGKALAGAVAVAAVGAAAFVGLKAPKGKRNPPPQPRASETSASAAAAAASARPPFPWTARWAVAYHDDALGDVRGTAAVDWEKGRAWVLLKDPRSGSEFPIASDDVKVDDAAGSVTMHLRGKSPSAPPIKPPSPQARSVAAEEGQTVEFISSARSATTTVRDKARPEADRVALTLYAAPFGVLRGEWSYLADPLTKRDSGGSGRSGFFRLLDKEEQETPHEGFIGTLSGEEIWSPLPSVIDDTMVVEGQLAHEGGSSVFCTYPYPFRGSERPKDEAVSRTLIVVGRELPFIDEKVLKEVSAEDDDLEYTVLATSAQKNVDPKIAALFEYAWQKPLAPFSDADRQEIRRRLQAALIKVSIKRPLLPGPQIFSWGEARGVWFLQFGDATAEARIVRQIRRKTAADPTSADQFERTSAVFLPEEVAVEVETRAVLPIDEIPVQVTNGSETLIRPATRIAGAPWLYRTALFTIGKKDAALAIEPGQKIKAAVRVDDLPFVTPPYAEANAYLTPDQMPGRTKPHSVMELRLWKEALYVVAETKGLDAGDLGKVSGTKVGSYDPCYAARGTEAISACIGQLANSAFAGSRNIPVTGGELAGMLLLRSTFLASMADQLAYLDSIKTDDDVLAFRQWLVPFMAPRPAKVVPEAVPPVGWEKYSDFLHAVDIVNAMISKVSEYYSSAASDAWAKLTQEKTHAGYGHGTFFGELSVSGPTGQRDFRFYETYGDDRMYEPFFHGDAKALREWRLKTGREVLKSYREAVQASIGKFRGIETDDIERLVDFTAIAYGPLVQKMIPTLMKLDDAGHWVPDMPARATVAELHTLVSAAQASSEFLKIAGDLTLKIAAELLTLAGPELVLSEEWAKAAKAVAPYALLDWQAGSAIWDEAYVHSDIDTLFGCAGVLGTDRLEELALQQTPYWKVLGSVGVNFGIGKLKGIAFETGYRIDEPVRLRSTQDRIGTGMRAVYAEALAPWLRQLSWDQVKKWQPQIVQGILESAEQAYVRNLWPKKLPVVDKASQKLPVVQVPRKLPVVVVPPPPKLPIVDRIVYAQPMSPAEAICRSEVVRFARDLDAGEPGKVPPGSGSLLPSPPLPPAAAGAQIQVFQPVDLKRIEEEIATTKVTIPAVAAGAERGTLPQTSTPARRGWFAIRDNGREIEFQVETDEQGNAKKIGEGASSEVYILKDIKGGDPSVLEGDGAVIKILKDSPDFGKPAQQVVRMQGTQALLEVAKKTDPAVRYVPILKFSPDADEPYVIQRRIPFEKGKHRQIKIADLVNPKIKVGSIAPALPFDQVQARFSRDYMRAYLRLGGALGKAGLGIPDLSLPNVDFDLEDGVWCELVDIDHIIRLADALPPETNHTWLWIDRIFKNLNGRMPSATLDLRDVTQAEVFMEKVMEMPMGGNRGNPFIELDGRSLEFKPVLLDPTLIPEYFPNFKLKVEEAKPARKSGLLQPVRWWKIEDGLARAA